MAPATTRPSPLPQAPPVDVSVVIVTYHCREHVRACLESLRSARTARRYEVIVVDNGSADGTVELLRADPLAVRVVEMGRNVGFAKATNVGIERAIGRHVLVLNPDTTVGVGALDRLVEWLDGHPDCGAAAPRLLNPDGSDQQTARSFPTPWAGVFGRRSPLTRWFPGNPWSNRYLSARSMPAAVPFRVDWVSGAAMMVTASVIARIGAFDEDFFLFWEDADWCRRMASVGLAVWCVPQAVVVHDEGGTRGHRWSPRTAAHFHRGAYLYWRKHHAPQPWNPARWAAAVILAARAVVVMAGAHRAMRVTPPAVTARPSR